MSNVKGLNASERFMSRILVCPHQTIRDPLLGTRRVLDLSLHGYHNYRSLALMSTEGVTATVIEIGTKNAIGRGIGRCRRS